MYNNLKRVLKEKGITNVMLAEAMKINKLLCPEYTMDFLFAVYLEAS